MTEQEAINELKFIRTYTGMPEEKNALSMAIKALEEVQEYRKHGTVKGYERALESSLENYLLYRAYKEKLAEYEDAEEQGLLLRSPCKVGDTVYAIPSWVNFRLNKSFGHAEHNRVYPQIVDHIEFSSYGYRISTCDGMQGHGQEAFGETWFFTREEAETKLAEMQKG